MNYLTVTRMLLLSSGAAALSLSAQAQDAPVGGEEPDDEIVVVGSQIRGSDIAGILPVTSLDTADIEITGAVSGDELLASIPQIGDVTFREGRFTGVNGARGDVGSINLRGVGDGNTLVLLNGRRVVNHPGTQAVNQTPVVSVNSNALPVFGVRRVEVLRDGASAVYGTDAVAGVINTILDDDFEGLTVQAQYGTSEGTDLNETGGVFKWGRNFNEGRTNVSLFGNFMIRNGMPATDLLNSSTEDLRPFFVGTVYEGDTQLRNTSTDTPWGSFRTVSGSEATGIGDNDFHIQPDTFDGCLGPALLGGVCADDGSSISTELRLDRARYRDIVGDVDRYNLFAFFNHEMENGTEFFGEASYYHADYSRERETAQLISSQRYQVSVPATAFYNPFGEAVLIGQFRPIDAGRRQISVRNGSFRILGGLRGRWSDWDWETALLHSEASTEDRTNRVSLTLFQQAIARTDASAYNVFAGGSLTDFSDPGTSNNQDTINSFLVEVRRDGNTSLTMADAKVSNPGVFALPAGDIGVAAGVEWRHESYEDDRDDRLDGTINFTDIVTGNELPSDVMGSSPTPDTEGDRDVFAAFVELAVPLVSPDMDLPLVHSLDMQLAARAEDYSDVGSVLKPKIAASWFPFAPLQIRGAYSEGFRAPNLEQINATAIRRVNTGREDWILCEALARDAGNPAFGNDDACDNVGVEGVRGGGPDLEPETSQNYSLGVTFQPTDFITFTVDWWRIEQENLVGLFSDQNEISLDYLLRLRGASNPNVVRGTPDPDLAGLFTGAGLDPSGAGEILEVNQTFRNLGPRTSEGLDIGAQFDIETKFGDVDVRVNAAQIREFFQDPSPEGQQLIDAVNSGTINPLVSVVGQEDLIRENGNPEWRYAGSIRWSRGQWGAGAFYRRVGAVRDTSVTGATYDFLEVPAFKTLSLSADYTFENVLAGQETRVRFGVRNVTDEKPPIADEFARGYFVGLHSNRGRYWYGNVRHTF